MNNDLEKASECKRIQLEETKYKTKKGCIKKIYIGERYFFVYEKDNMDHNNKVNLFVFYHGSRDIAMNCILSSTSLIETFGEDNWIIVFGQCDGKIETPYINPKFGKIGFGEIYWGITYLQNKDEDIEYTKKLVNIIESQYKIEKKVFMGHSNGGVFSLLIPIYLPNVFDFIISHQGGIGWDPLFELDFYLLDREDKNDKKEKILFYTGSLDGHKSVCEAGHNIFLAEGYESEIIIIEGLKHNYEKECELIIKKWIEK
jgi:predicted esterase